MANKSVPSWLDNLFFEKVLRSGEDDSTITVTSSEVTKATIAGDHYASEMYRAKVKMTRNGKSEQRSLIIKCTISTKNKVSDMVEKSKFFDREIHTFAQAHPELIRLQKKAFKENYLPFAATYFYSNTDERGTTIIMEDLKEQGFKLADAASGLDMKHCLVVMRKIAKYHAASVAARQRNADCFSNFMGGAITKEIETEFGAFFQTNLRACAKVVEKWPEYKNRFVDKLTKMIDTATETWLDALKMKESEFNVLIHGDLWTNNMMFKYSEETGEVEDVRFVDFQLTDWSSPTVDLQYFLNSSAMPEIVENSLVLIDEYYRVLCESLQLLGYEQLKPTEAQINNQINNRGAFGVLAATSVRSVVLADRTKVPDIDNMMSEEGEIHLSEPYKQSIRTLLPFYEKRGWI